MVKVRLGEIHMLEVDPETTPDRLRKRSRKLAMTGGYELVLREGLNSDQLVSIFEMYQGELQQYSKSDLRYRSCSAYRIMKLLHDTGILPDEIKKRLENEVFSEEESGVSVQ